jgi:FdhD protein
LLARISPLPSRTENLDAQIIHAAVSGLRDRQPVFARTGGCHAASLVTFEGDHIATFEDVGRHNAVDKVVGSRVLLGGGGELPLSEAILIVSGRSSFEIVQKAFSAGIRVIASVSAPSSLAVDLAKQANITLCGFVRDGSLSVYAGSL